MVRRKNLLILLIGAAALQGSSNAEEPRTLLSPLPRAIGTLDASPNIARGESTSPEQHLQSDLSRIDDAHHDLPQIMADTRIEKPEPTMVDLPKKVTRPWSNRGAETIESEDKIEKTRAPFRFSFWHRHQEGLGDAAVVASKAAQAGLVAVASFHCGNLVPAMIAANLNGKCVAKTTRNYGSTKQVLGSLGTGLIDAWILGPLYASRIGNTTGRFAGCGISEGIALMTTLHVFLGKLLRKQPITAKEETLCASV